MSEYTWICRYSIALHTGIVSTGFGSVSSFIFEHGNSLRANYVLKVQKNAPVIVYLVSLVMHYNMIVILNLAIEVRNTFCAPRYVWVFSSISGRQNNITWPQRVNSVSSFPTLFSLARILRTGTLCKGSHRSCKQLFYYSVLRPTGLSTGPRMNTEPQKAHGELWQIHQDSRYVSQRAF